MKELVAGIVSVGTLSFLLFLFVMFWIKGEFYVGEPNLLIRTGETVFLILGLILALERYLGDIDRIKRIKKAIRNRNFFNKQMRT